MPGPSSTTSKPAQPDLQFDSIEDSIEAFKSGAFIIVLDSPSRENEADLIIAASALTPSKCAFMVHHTSGLLCTPLTASLASQLFLAPMIPPTSNRDPNRTAYTVSVDAAHPDVTTGISAHDRSLTCRALAKKGVRKDEFRSPGHVFPLVARDGGVRERRGHTEAGVEFCRLAGKGEEVAVICELVSHGQEERERTERRGEDGMMRGEEAVEFARRWGLKVCTIEALVEFVEKREGKGVVNGAS